MKRNRHYGKYIFRWLIALLLLIGIFVTAIVGGTRLYHIFMTSTGRQAADIPSEADYPVRGVDVSYYQGTIEWDTLEAQGITFAFLKATEGVDHCDTQFLENWNSGLSSGIYIGAYHFYRFEDSGAEQAQHFIDTVPLAENTLPPVIDVELYDSLTEDPDPNAVQENLQEMLDILEAYYGVKPILYAAPNTYRAYIKYFQDDYPIWISNYYYEPYSDWTFWQYTDSGLLEGYHGDQIYIDLNVYNGTLDAFLKEFGLN